MYGDEANGKDNNNSNNKNNSPNSPKLHNKLRATKREYELTKKPATTKKDILDFLILSWYDDFL